MASRDDTLSLTLAYADATMQVQDLSLGLGRLGVLGARVVAEDGRKLMPTKGGEF